MIGSNNKNDNDTNPIIFVGKKSLSALSSGIPSRNNNSSQERYHIQFLFNVFYLFVNKSDKTFICNESQILQLMALSLSYFVYKIKLILFYTSSLLIMPPHNN